MNQHHHPNSIPVYMLTPLRASLARWYADERGAVSTFILMMLPLFFLALFGLNAVWQVATAKQALRTGVYQAARFLSAEPQQEGNRDVWSLAARRVIERELQQTPGYRLNDTGASTATTRAQFLDLFVIVPEPPSLGNCPPGGRRAFTVRAELQVNIALLPGLPVSGGLSLGLPLNDSAEGEVICPE